jgi:small-conductance mechanosensitive channel
MESIDQLPPYLKKLLTPIFTVEFLWQLALVAVAIGIGYYLHLRFKAYVYERLGVSESRQLRLGRLAFRGSERIVFPLSVFLLVGFVKSIAEAYKIHTPLLDIVIPLSLSLAVVRVSIYILRRSFTPSPAIRAWEGVISLFVWSVVALYLLGWLGPVQAALDGVAFKIGNARFSLLSIIKLGIVLAILVTVANWVSRRLEGMTSKTTQMSSGMRVGLVKFTKVVLYTVAVLISLDSVGIDLTTLTVFGGALGVGVGFGLQRIASNFISGFILLFDRSIKPGDVISIGTRFGWVQELHARYIVVRDRDGVETLIPNENLITSEVINWSYSDRLVRMKIPVQISYESDPEVAMDILVDESKKNSRVLADPEPQARIIEFGDNGIGLELRVWYTDPEKGIANLKSDIYLAIWKRFKESGITIPFPQRDVHIVSQPGGAE